MRLKERFDAWMKRLVAEAVSERVPGAAEIAQLLNAQIDYADLIDQTVSRLEDDIDTDEIARKVGNTISASDVAYHMDAEDVASYVEVDADEIAEKVAEEIDVSSCIDYDKLAEALVSKLKEAWA
jgi:hypothetical protein